MCFFFFYKQKTAFEMLISDWSSEVCSSDLVVVIGPCSIHNPVAAIEYAKRLVAQRERFKGELEIIMRVYFEKPRTTVGWKGLINDPGLDGSFNINQGLRTARELLIQVNKLGLPDRKSTRLNSSH